MNKYFAKKIKTIHGIFDSKTEFERFLYLKTLQDKGIISGLKQQVRFEIIPTLYKLVEVTLKTKTKTVQRVDEMAAHYTADFTYNRDGKLVIEEVKSKGTMLARDYPLRRKLIKRRIYEMNKHNGNNNIIFNEYVVK